MPLKFAKQLKPQRGFRAALQEDGVFELLVYEEIGEDWWSGDGLTAKMFKQKLDSAGVYARIRVRINSPGGDAFEGIAIGNVLKSAGKPVDVIIDGIAASAASIIAMCGDTISMASNSMMMIHNAWTMAIGDSRAMAKMGDTLGKIDGAIAQTYVDKTGKPMAAIRALMDEETWMTQWHWLANSKR
jgi:ATP-dependent Clp protease, protease subunit